MILRTLRDVSGQTQILAAAVIGLVMLTAGLYSLDYAQKAERLEVRAGKRAEMRAALDAAVRHASNLYHSQSGCDPVSLDSKLSRLRLDGSLAPAGGAATARQMNVTISNNTYRVAFGPVTRLKWSGNANPVADPTVGGVVGAVTYNTGISQDAVVEVWTYISGRQAGGQTQQSGQRVVQYAALINNCTYPCACDAVADPTCTSGVGTSGQCSVKADRAIAFHRFTALPPPTLNASKVANAWNRRCSAGTRYTADLKTTATPACPPSPASNTLDIRDLLALKNYLRSGDWAGSCTTLIAGTGANDACADLDIDGQITEIDLSNMEKVLRGYLYWIPVHF